jgi:hypothetical protein
MKIILSLFLCLIGLEASAQFPPPTYHGSFIGDGSRLTNLNVAALTGTSFTYITNGSSFAQINAAITTPSNFIVFQPGDYLNMSNMVPANYVSIYAPGTTLHLGPTYTGLLVDCFTNVLGFTVYGLRLTGDAFAQYNSSTFIKNQTGFVGLYQPWYIGTNIDTYTNRSGIRLNAGGGGSVIGMQVDGFGGYGYFLNSAAGQGSFQQGNPMAFSGNSALSNWLGLYMPAASYEWAQPGDANEANWVVGAVAEYQTIEGFTAHGNGIGAEFSAGNHNIVGGDLSGNYLGAFVGGGQNSAHGTIVGVTLNHSHLPVVINQTQEFVKNCTLLADDEILFDSVTPGAIFNDNTIIGDGSALLVIATNSSGQATGQLSFGNNTYGGNFGTGITISTNMGPAHSGNVLQYNNQTYTGTALDNDGTAMARIATGQLINDQSGLFSLFTGESAGNLAQTGTFNSGFGWGALNAITTGLQNTAIGAEALFRETTANANTAVGGGALVSLNGDSGGNTAIGYNAGSGNSTGSFNGYFGAYTAGVNGENNTFYLGGTNVLVVYITGSNSINMDGPVNFTDGAMGNLSGILVSPWTIGTNVSWNASITGALSNSWYVSSTSSAMVFHGSGSNSLGADNLGYGYGHTLFAATNGQHNWFADTTGMTGQVVTPQPSLQFTLTRSNYYSPSNIYEEGFVEGTISSPSASQFITNQWPLTPGAGTNLSVDVYCAQMHVNSYNGTTNAWLSTPIQCSFTNNGTTQGRLSGFVGAFTGNSAPGSVGFSFNSVGWNVQFTPASSATIHVASGPIYIHIQY